MRFDIITIFPEVFEDYFNSSILKRARKAGLIDIRVHDLRDFVGEKNKKGASGEWFRRQVDDRPFGGGAGMVLKAEPIILALESLLKPSSPKSQVSSLKQEENSKILKSKTKIILLSARGRQFDAKMARGFAKNYGRIIMICGHYEGIDERVRKIASDFLARRTSYAKAGGMFRVSDLSVGPYILTGGELPAMVIADAVLRHIPGVLGKRESLEEIKGSYPAYTRPEVFSYKGKKYRVPKILLSGNHKKIEEWRRGKG